MSSVQNSITRVTQSPGQLLYGSKKTLSEKSNTNQLNQIVVTDVDADKEHDEAQLGRARTLKSDKYARYSQGG